MLIIRASSDFPRIFEKATIAIGNFDGVHWGHQAILDAALLSRAAGPVGVLTFDPHPRAFFNPGQPPFLLTTIEDRAEILKDLGLDFMVVEPFTPALSQLSPQEFVDEVLIRRLKIRGVAVGEDFTFGHKRQGNVALLRTLGEENGFTVAVCPQVKNEGGEAFSSTAIRDALKKGDITTATRLLGRPWQVRGIVGKGDQQGRVLGTPTANLKLGPYLKPLYGIYAVEVEHKSDVYQGVASFGVRPTVDGKNEWLEAHLFNFNGDLYGETLKVRFIAFLRAEEKFDSLDALKDQITQDIQNARTVFARGSETAIRQKKG